MPRRVVLALLIMLAVGVAPAAADYTRLADVRPDDDIALVGDAVLVGVTPAGGASTLTAYGLDGSARAIALPGEPRFVEELNASDDAVVTITLPAGGGRQRGHFGTPEGPLRPLPRAFVDVAVTGDTVVSLHDRGAARRGWLELRRPRGRAVRRVDLPGRQVAVVTAAGRFAAYAADFASNRETTIVIDLDTGRERYRVRTPQSTAYGLAPNGRLWFLSGGRRSGRILTATPRRPRPRTVARMRLHPYELAVTRGEIAVARTSRSGRSQVVLVRPDGDRRTVTPTVPALGALAYDGTTLAFGAGHCVFAGPVPPNSPGPLSLTGCEP
jgi:hypothetical protein